MRGKAHTSVFPRSSVRITPAYAGKSLLLCEHCGKPIGSPPPMRGKVVQGTQFHEKIRITPAYAGKRQRQAARSAACTDHPRLCGEKVPVAQFAQVAAGSPPPMRGKEIRPEIKVCDHRITPAYAGKRMSSCLFFQNTRDHPRLCGEKSPPS